MTPTNSYRGVRQIVVDNLGDGSITVEPGSQQDLVEASIVADDDQFDQYGADGVPFQSFFSCGSVRYGHARPGDAATGASWQYRRL